MGPGEGSKRNQSKEILNPGGRKHADKQHELGFCTAIYKMLTCELSLEGARLFCVNYMVRNETNFPLRSEIGNLSSSFSEEEIQRAIKGNYLNPQ